MATSSQLRIPLLNDASERRRLDEPIVDIARSPSCDGAVSREIDAILDLEAHPEHNMKDRPSNGDDDNIVMCCCLHPSQFRILLRVSMPILLWIQFALAQKSGALDTANLSWMSIQCCIAAFTLFSVLYRSSLTLFIKAFESHQVDNSDGDDDDLLATVVHLFPEIAADVVLLLVVANCVGVAALVLQCSAVMMGVNATLFWGYTLAFSRTTDSDDDGDSVLETPKKAERHYESLPY